MAHGSRREQIEQLVNKEGTISLSKLKLTFPDISEMTLRRDLDFLDKSNRIIRVYGGAKSVNYAIGTDDNYTSRAVRNIDKKRSLANAALSLLRNNTSLYIDSGSTFVEFCRLFPDNNYLIYTNGLHCALELSKLTKPDIHMVGGKLNNPSLSLMGSNAIASISNVNFNLAFIGCTGYTLSKGFTCGNDEDARLKQTILSRADKVVILMDSTKIDISSTFTFATPDEVDILVTDSEIDSDTVKSLRKHNVEVLC